VEMLLSGHMSENNICRTQQVIDELTESLSGDLDKINKDYKIDREDVGSPHAGSESNPLSIHFCLTSDAERQTFSELVTDELILRDMPPFGARTEHSVQIYTVLFSPSRKYMSY
jgi:hypothetical protein